MRSLMLIVAGIMSGVYSFAGEPMEIKLYPNGEPNSNELDYAKYAEMPEGIQAMEAVMYVYLPETTNHIPLAVLIFPGGGYGKTAIDHEGHQVARWLNKLGIAGIVLRYRMPNGHSEIPLYDAQRAYQIICERASEWNIVKSRIGVMGFSAGGHLASTLSTHFVKWDERPAFSVLIYPVITMKEELCHKGSRKNLLGENPTEEYVKRFSNELRVTEKTPPAFIALSDNDASVNVRNSIEYYMALKSYGIPAEMHIYPTGGHGWGMRDDFIFKDEFKTSLARWLAMQKKTE